MYAVSLGKMILEEETVFINSITDQNVMTVLTQPSFMHTED